MGCYILADIKEDKHNTYICCKHNHYLETYNINDAAEFNSILGPWDYGLLRQIIDIIIKLKYFYCSKFRK